MIRSLAIPSLVLLGCCVASAYRAAVAAPDAVPVSSPAPSPPAVDKPTPVSPYALAARRHALAAAHTPLLVIPPSQRHTRSVSGQIQQH